MLRFHVQADWHDAGGEYDAAYGFGAGDDGAGDEAEMVGTADEIAAELRRYLTGLDPEFMALNGVQLVLKVALLPEGQ